MLLTDGSPNNADDLRVYESAILDVCHTEQIALDVKLNLATEEISEDILDLLLDHTRSTDPLSDERRTIGVSDVVVTPQLKRWNAVHTLEIVYRDAFNNQLNDRYLAKFKEYHELSKNAKEHTYRYGIGLVLAPIPEAQVPTISFAAGPLPATLYFIRVTWVGTGTNAEGAPSPETTYESPAGSVPVVTAVNPPAGTIGFNVYIGLSSGSETLQNSSPIPAGQSFTLPSTGLVAGAAVGNGQTPDTYVVGGFMLRRG